MRIMRTVASFKLMVLPLIWGIILAFACCFAGISVAEQVYYPPELQFQPTTLPFIMSSNNILVDNFEYWSSPHNNGWITNEPAYPVWGAGIGYGQLNTVLDFQEGSRVLDVYMPASVFLPNLQRFSISKAVFRPVEGDRVIGPENGYLSFKIRAPLAIERFDSFAFIINGTLSDDTYYSIQMMPRETCPDCASYEETATEVSEPGDNRSKPGLININIGRQYADGTWHIVYMDLNKIITDVWGDQGLSLETIDSITILGNQYRLDDIIFHSHDHIEGDPPYLFKISHIYAQLFVPIQRLVFATDDFCHPYDVLTDANDIRNAWIDDNRVDDDAVDLTQIDCNIPVLATQHMRLSDNDHAEDMLRFYSFVGGGGQNGIWSPNMIQPLPIDPNDAYPLFLPAYYRLMDDDEEIAVAHAIGCSHHSEGTFYFSPQRAHNIELALKQAGYTHWPMVAMLQFTPQTMENLVVTVEVSDGMARDVETFMVSTVNFPVENYPPILEDLDDQVAYVGEVFQYPLSGIDPDTCIYSSTHPKADQFTLTWSMTLAGLSSYKFGPWQEPLINTRTGLIQFTPQFEGAYPAVIILQDDRGFYSIGEFTIFCVNRGTWLNHAPIVLGDWDHPQVCHAGELFVLSEPTLAVEDPDGDKIYYSCNTGSIGTDADGHVIWTFQTNFPGFYVVEIIAYDSRGAYAVISLELEVRPYWSL